MPRKTVEDWEAKGWERVSIPAGSTDPIEIDFDPDTQDLVLKGQLYTQDGVQLTGPGRPKLRVEATAIGGAISIREPSKANVVALFKIVEEDEDEGT